MRWKDDIPEEVKQERLQRLIDLQNEISNEERQQMLGQTLRSARRAVQPRRPACSKGAPAAGKK